MTLSQIENLSDEEKRVMIAEACGIKEQNECPSCHLYRGQGHTSFCDFIPDYLNSLDCIHEAEKTLTTDLQLRAYLLALTDVCQEAEPDPKSPGHAAAFVIMATARQRAIAFLTVKSDNALNAKMEGVS